MHKNNYEHVIFCLYQLYMLGSQRLGLSVTYIILTHLSGQDEIVINVLLEFSVGLSHEQ